ncbi:MAG: hypothetical protein HOV81_02335 [Kofleriaceae bacterium]|nr:hypothetical protein [Kofleriaceae bacterium]
MKLVGAALGVLCVAVLSACPPPGQGGYGGAGGGGGRGGAAINPDACGSINTSNVGRKMYAFLVASAELDRSSFELENSVRDACAKMARELGVSPDGDTRTVCTRAKQELDANLQVSVKTEKRLVTKYTPPVCKTDIDFTAGFAAECEAKASADIDVSCSGRCGGTCNGTCDGQCAGGATGGQCNGQCNGTCRGDCHGSCEGYADVDASAECKASAEIRATTHTTCTPAKTEIVQQDVTVVDATKWNKAMAAINVGLPELLTASKKLELTAKAVVLWVQTGASLVRASGELAGELGAKGACVGAQIAGVVAATANIQARIDVSIEVSASVSASAGATAQ